MKSHKAGTLSRFILAARRRFTALVHGELGVETAQVILLVPLFIGLLWSAFEAWQIMSIKTAMRTAASQATRYVTAYNYHEGPNSPDTIIPPDRVARGVVEIVQGTLGRRRGIMGDALEWDIEWYGFRSPTVRDWDNNAYYAASLSQSPFFLQSLECNQQFAIRLVVEVPWRTILFGLPGKGTTDYTLVLQDVAIGAVPCLPECKIINAQAYATSSGPGGCEMRVEWDFPFDDLDNAEASYVPEHIWLANPGDMNIATYGPWDMEDGHRFAPVPILADCGSTGILVVGGYYDTINPDNIHPECVARVTLQCDCPPAASETQQRDER